MQEAPSLEQWESYNRSCNLGWGQLNLEHETWSSG